MPTTTIIGYPETLQALPQAERRAITNALDTAANITNPAERQALLQAITGVVAARRRCRRPAIAAPSEPGGI